MVADTCAFRPAVLAALGQRGVAWRTVFENGSLEATASTVRADLAVTAWLASTVPGDLSVLPASADLPDLPSFTISLQQPINHPGPAIANLAQHIRDAFVLFRQAA